MDAMNGIPRQAIRKIPRWGRWAAVLAIVALGASMASPERAPGHEATTPAAAAHHDHHGDDVSPIRVVAPSAPTDGRLEIVVPQGLDAAMKASGDPAYHMPSVIRVRVGDTVVIRNEDTVPHMILYTFLLPGETDTRLITRAGSEAYSSGCAANAADFHDFTTIFIAAAL